MVQLPNELVDCILDNLYPDKAILLSCALVSRAWARSSRRGIFRRIALELPPHDQGDPTSIDAFLKNNGRLSALFFEKPHLALYVRELYLGGRHYRARDQAEGLEVLLNATTDILSPLLKTTLTGLFNSLTRVSLSIYSIRTFAELVSLLSHGTSLKVLDIDMFCSDGVWDLVPLSVPEFDIEETGATNHPVRSTQLDKLRFSEVDDAGISFFLAWFQRNSCLFDVQHLRALCLEVSFDMIVKTLQYVGRNLSELELRLPKISYYLSFYNRCPDSAFDFLKYTPNLRSLQFLDVIPISVIQAVFKPFLDPLARIRLPLQHFTILLWLDCSTGDEWGLVDALFAKPEFALLKTITLKQRLNKQIWEAGGTNDKTELMPLRLGVVRVAALESMSSRLDSYFAAAFTTSTRISTQQ
ncbi:hypothetical protein BT96DRAFT_1023975 [Gymnopus androsaceus JB14]|uniref:F-box domain-containing protein n=1 Tax=Gymnopus androsaceus JB14 TaxID=1447944 RepID=A0A6A4H3A3_9AGAR|nr:hypothetical protein BT96DRAFT_1023975 [Gymnopus androsaceus JB14]